MTGAALARPAAPPFCETGKQDRTMSKKPAKKSTRRKKTKPLQSRAKPKHKERGQPTKRKRAGSSGRKSPSAKPKSARGKPKSPASAQKALSTKGLVKTGWLLPPSAYMTPRSVADIASMRNEARECLDRKMKADLSVSRYLALSPHLHELLYLCLMCASCAYGMLRLARRKCITERVCNQIRFLMVTLAETWPRCRKGVRKAQRQLLDVVRSVHSGATIGSVVEPHAASAMLVWSRRVFDECYVRVVAEVGCQWSPVLPMTMVSDDILFHGVKASSVLRFREIEFPSQKEFSALSTQLRIEVGASDAGPLLSRSASRVWKYIRRFARENSMLPTYENICHNLCVGRSTVSNAHKELRKFGFLKRFKGTRKGVPK